MVSADSALAAFSKDIRVRVDASKKRVATVLPRSAGTFGMGRAQDLCEDVGVVEVALDLGSFHALGGEQVPHSPTSPPSPVTRSITAGSMTTASPASTSSSRTDTRSPGAVGRFLPT